MINLDKLSESQILGTKISDLDLELNSEQKQKLKDLNKLLMNKNIKWRPHVWLSDEWFSPDGVSGFAVPFTLAHKKLMAIEKKHLGYCEGEKPREFLKLCCHESGHAIDNAYKLRLNKSRQAMFGLTSKKYPSSYKPNPNSSDYIHFLEDHYAQAHPDEDWAETFGYFLMNEKWNSQYNDTKVIEKLELVRKIVSQLKQKPFKKNSEKTPMSYKYDDRTVEQYLTDKKKSLGITQKNYYETKVRNKFTKKIDNQTASSFMQLNKKEIIHNIQFQTKLDTWTITKCFNELKQECKSKKYTLKYNKASQFKIQNIIGKNIEEYIQKGKTRIYM